ncbi:MAG: hypothetical protein ACREJF_05020, partial [Candidatus Methylomirabilales bacterium]
MSLGSQVVDTESAEEFMRETLEAVSSEDFSAISALLATKSEGFGALLGAPGRARALERADLHRVLRSVFSSRRKADVLIDGVGFERLGAGIDDLLHGPDELPARFEAFDALLAGHPDPGFDLPSELLHFTAPDRYWLWTRWMWDPHNETGALRLVTMDGYDLRARTFGEMYLK